MKDQEVLSEIATAFEYCYLHEDWVNPLDEALDGLTAQQALWRRSSDAKCIWEIVLHMAVWNDNIVERTRTRTRTHPADGAWPELPPVTSEAAWETAKAKLRTSLDNVKALLTESTLDELQSAPYGLADLLCRFTHIGYHIGQITVLRDAIPSGI